MGQPRWERDLNEDTQGFRDDIEQRIIHEGTGLSNYLNLLLSRSALLILLAIVLALIITICIVLFPWQALFQ
jgi:hypothetical protein